MSMSRKQCVVLAAFALLSAFLLVFSCLRAIRQRGISLTAPVVDEHDSDGNPSRVQDESPSSSKIPLETSSKHFFATTDPTHPGFRNEMTFRSVQTVFGRQHPASEKAYNSGGCKSMFTLKIVDLQGMPVEGASVDVGPSLNWSRLPLQQYVTDSTGVRDLLRIWSRKDPPKPRSL
jgi:hypothetical protein